jgi:hypothetical protein
VKVAVVSGAIANKRGNGGATWTRLSWAVGLKRLGFRVCFVEQIGRESCVDAAGAPTSLEESASLAYFRTVTERFGLADCAALLYEDGQAVAGMERADLLALADGAELLLNITGHLTWQPLLRRARRRAYLDLDPGFTQLWHAQGNAGMRLEGHDVYFTVGENIGQPDCPIPTGGLAWRPTRQPFVPEHWPVAPAERPGRFTTVASWRGPYGPVEHAGTTYGLKVHEFRRFVDLPRRVDQRFEVALDIHPADAADLRRLREHGWWVVDPREVAGDPDAFRRYVQGSGAEFSVAQGVYVHTNSGWFSDRTVRYLASGRPALVQDTGFVGRYPVGEGLLAFRTPEEAADGAARIEREYGAHCRAARELAERHFASDRVLGDLVEQAGVAP